MLECNYGDPQMLEITWENVDDLFEQAKAIEKEQIEEAYLNGCSRVTPYGYYNDSAEQYYKETYES